MPLGVYLPEKLLNLAFLVDHHRVPVGVLVSLDPKSLGDFVVGIHQEWEGQIELLLKSLVARGVVVANAEDLGILVLILGIIVTEIARFDRAARGVVLGIKVNDDVFFALEIL